MKKVFEHFKQYNAYSAYAAKSELKTEVTNSYLTWIWWILDPLFFMIIYSFIVQIVFQTDQPYLPVFVFIGLLVWNFFSKNISVSVGIVNAFKGVVTKVYIPKYMLVLEKMYVNFVKLAISYVLLYILAVIFGVTFTWDIIYTIPLIALTFLFTFGLATMLAHFGVFVNDLANVVQIILRLMFYLSGIFFSVSERIPEALSWWMLRINPIAYIIDDFRNVFLYGRGLTWDLFAYWIIVSLILIVIAIRTMYKYENTYAKVI